MLLNFIQGLALIVLILYLIPKLTKTMLWVLFGGLFSLFLLALYLYSQTV